MKKLPAILLIAVLTVFIYYAIWIGIDLSYHIIYSFVPKPHLYADFGRELWIYDNYILIPFLVFTNLMLAIVEKKIINRIAVFIAYSLCILWWWGGLIISPWPYRAVPIFCVLTVFYLLDISLARFIVKKLLHKNIL
ncbi:MAG: hypothetical protein LBQ87_06430 [Candidatus Fibromonas sp.]|jgi:hypothetical protein|nr:hypothetical protein [Candidatus Fibromonas sp.]